MNAIPMQAGVWIDHHRAVVVLLRDGKEEVLEILADRDLLAAQAPVKNTYTRNDFVAEDQLERKAASELREYYDEVLGHLRHAGAIVVLGPGEAKKSFMKRLDSKKIPGRLLEIETVGKLTDGQIVQHVRQHFHESLAPSAERRVL